MSNIVILVGSMRKMVIQICLHRHLQKESVKIILWILYLLPITRSIHVLAVIHVLRGRGISAFKMMTWMGYMKS